MQASVPSRLRDLQQAAAALGYSEARTLRLLIEAEGLRQDELARWMLRHQDVPYTSQESLESTISRVLNERRDPPRGFLAALEDAVFALCDEHVSL